MGKAERAHHKKGLDHEGHEDSCGLHKEVASRFRYRLIFIWVHLCLSVPKSFFCYTVSLTLPALKVVFAIVASPSCRRRQIFCFFHFLMTTR